VAARIAELSPRPVRSAWRPPPPIEDTLRRLDEMAATYRRQPRALSNFDSNRNRSKRPIQSAR
jgi:hypothetical protein